MRRLCIPLPPALAAALVVALGCGACERLAGIHSSTGANPRDAAPTTDGDGRGNDGNDASGDGSQAEHAATDSGDANDGTTLPDGRRVDALPDVMDGGNEGDAAGGGDAAPLDGSPDQAAGPVCGADPSVAVPLSGTAFRFGSGPGSGAPSAKGMCSFLNSQLPGGMYYGAVETALYSSAARCGACMRVRTGSVTVEVQVIDVLQPLPSAHGATISVDPAAQMMLSPAGGNPDVQFSFVPCSVTGNIQIAFLGALNPSVVVMNHRNQLQAVQLVTATMTLNLSRQAYNAWTPPQGFIFGGGTVSLVLTDTFGNSVRVANVAVTTAQTDTGQQFPLCPK